MFICDLLAVSAMMPKQSQSPSQLPLRSLQSVVGLPRGLLYSEAPH